MIAEETYEDGDPRVFISKLIKTPSDLDKFTTSKTMNQYIEFLEKLNDSCKNKKLSDPFSVSPVCAVYLKI